MQAMTGIDRLVGELRNKLTALKLDKNTIIIFIYFMNFMFSIT